MALGSNLLKVGLLITGRVDGSVGRATNSAIGDHKRLGSAVGRVKSRLGSTRDAQRYGRSLNRLERIQRSAGRSSAALDNRIERVTEQYQQARRAARGYAGELDDVAEAETRARRSRAGDDGPIFSRRDVARSVVAGGMAAVGASLFHAAKLEEAGLHLESVINAVDGNREAAVARTRKAARDFARGSLASESELLTINYELNSAGLDEELAIAGSQITHKLATITKGNAQEVSAIIGTTYNNLGDGLTGDAESKMSQIGNVLARTQFKYQISDFGQLGEGLKYAAVQATALKVPLTQTAAIVGQLNTSGLTGTRAGTAFAAMARNMGKAGEELGFAMQRNQDGSLDMVGTIGLLDEALGGLDTDARAARLQEIFGEEGMAGVQPLLENIDALREGTAELAEVAGSDLVNARYDRFANSSMGRFTRLTGNILQTAGAIGQHLLPVMNAVLTPIGGLLGAVSWAAENVPGVGLAIGVLGTAVLGLAGYVMVAGTAQWALNTAMGVFTSRTAIGAIGAVGRYAGALIGLGARALPIAIAGTRALTLAMMANPIGFIIGAIAIGATLIIANWSKVSTFFKGLWNGIKTPLSAIGKGLKAAFMLSPIGLFVSATTRGVGVILGGLSRLSAFGSSLMERLGKAILGPARLIDSVLRRVTGVSIFAVADAINNKRGPDDGPEDGPDEGPDEGEGGPPPNYGSGGPRGPREPAIVPLRPSVAPAIGETVRELVREPVIVPFRQTPIGEATRGPAEREPREGDRVISFPAPNPRNVPSPAPASAPVTVSHGDTIIHLSVATQPGQDAGDIAQKVADEVAKVMRQMREDEAGAALYGQ